MKQSRYNFIFYILTALFIYTGCSGHRVHVKENNKDFKTPKTPAAYNQDKPKQEIFKKENKENSRVFSTNSIPEQKIENIVKKTGKKAYYQKKRPGYTITGPDSHSTDKKGDLNSGDIVFNFDNADLYEVIRTMAELLEINYIVDPNVKGSVTIHTAGNLGKEDIFSVFFQVLDANGLTAVKDGSLYKIIPIKDASRLPILASDTNKNIPSEERLVMQIIPLGHISASEMTKLLTPFVSKDGTILSHENSRTLLIVDRAKNILKALKLVKAFDIDIFQTLSYRLYTIRHVDAEEMVELLDDILSAYGDDVKKDIKIIAIERLNTILAMSSDPGVFDRLSAFINQIDKASDEIEPQIYVYSVKNGEAEELSELLNTVFTGKTDTEKKNITKESDKKTKKSSESSPKLAPSPFNNKNNKKETPKKNVSVQANNNKGSGTLRGDIKIIPDTIRNALIIEAIPSDYRIVTDILTQIDVLPRQVLIEATIAEITLDNSTNLGVSWSFAKTGSSDTGLLTANIGEQGLSYTIGLTEKWTNAISALASQKKVNILSSPIILASDNKEAQINVSTKIPIPSTEYQYETDSQPIFQTSIQYRDTGLILSVTPHINERGLVSMDISQEISEEGAGIEVGGKNYSTFRERLVKTTLTVKDGQTIVLGGLMEETKDDGGSGVPFFSDLPFIGYLFGKKSNSFIKKELIILLTPRVIITQDDVDIVTEEFKRKVSNIKENFDLRY